ncbi:MAG: hypothetical protein JJU36_08925 [Phycisphaeraceae bacterium]|nr:hypothetical protein [Phycisphaeraceae bacterium]
MPAVIPMALVTFLVTLIALPAALAPADEPTGDDPERMWRSELYPDDWSPPTVDSHNFATDKLIQDFSYAGYRRGDQPLPRVQGPVFNVNDSRFGADPSGEADSTEAIQRAIDAAAAAGGGVVMLPAGTYRLTVNDGAALRIRSGNIVLRGDGPDKTFLLNETRSMRSSAIISVAGPADANWRNPRAPSTPITRDLMGPTRRVPVAETGLFEVGGYVVVLADVTPEWVREHHEPEWLGHEARLGGPAYYRRVTAIDAQAGVIEIDAPTRYDLRRRDHARVAAAGSMPGEIGLEDFAIGNMQIDDRDGWGEEDYRREHTAAGRAHASAAIRMTRVHDSWIRNVHSFRAEGNNTGTHILSNGILLNWCRGITIADCRFGFGQYGGGGGNGYMYRLTNCNECLVLNSVAEFSRHGFVLSHMASSGNVFHRCVDRDTGLATGATGRQRTAGRSSDHHMHLSHSNLFDQCIGRSSWFQAAYRPFGSVPRHNLTAAHSVFWNTRGEGEGGPIVHSEQARYGYVIGTQGPRSAVRTSGRGGEKTDPPDHVEGIGRGAFLQPQSLYLDQVQRRRDREP